MSDLVAPPYDVIGPDLQATLYARSPHNVVRVDLGTTQPGDDHNNNQYTRAAGLLAGWKSTGVLERDTQPTVTFVEETFTGPDGRRGCRHGLLALIRLSEFGEGTVFPHEHTLSGPKEDRYRLMTATEMSLSPVFLLYDLPADEITTAWRDSLGGQAPTSSVTDDAGSGTKLWATSDPRLLDLVTGRLSASRFLVADGHHRYETALRYRDWAQTRGGRGRGERPTSAASTASAASAASAACEFCLAYFANMSDPALTIYPTHRLVSGLPEALIAGLPQALASTFSVERLEEPGAPERGRTAPTAQSALTAIEAYLKLHARGAFGLWGPSLDAAYGFRLVDPAAVHIDPGRKKAYLELDVVVLQNLVLERYLGIPASGLAAEDRVDFLKDAADALAKLQAGQAQLGFFLNPTGLDQVREVAFGGDRMPQKTTFFYPKLPTGLVFHDLTGQL